MLAAANESHRTYHFCKGRAVHSFAIWLSIWMGVGALVTSKPMAALAGPEPPLMLAQQTQDIGVSEETLLKQGRRLYATGLFAQAVTSFQAAAEAYAGRGDRANQALSLSYCSLALQELAQWQAAEGAIAASLKLLKSNSVGPCAQYPGKFTVCHRQSRNCDRNLGQRPPVLSARQRSRGCFGEPD
jgi:hypothetical protein